MVLLRVLFGKVEKANNGRKWENHFEQRETLEPGLQGVFIKKLNH